MPGWGVWSTPTGWADGRRGGCLIYTERPAEQGVANMTGGNEIRCVIDRISPMRSRGGLSFVFYRLWLGAHISYGEHLRRFPS